MMIGSGGMVLLLMFGGMVALSLVARQRFAPWTAIAGIAMLGYLALSLVLQTDFLSLYRVLNPYVAFFVGVLLSVAGGIGIAARLIKKRT